MNPPLPSSSDADAVPEPRALWSDFAPLVSGRASNDEVVRVRYGRDASVRCRQRFLTGKTPPLPDLVVWPESIGEVEALVRRAREIGVSVTPVGGLSNRFGAAHFGHGGLCVDLKRMNRVLAIDADSLEVSCEAGILGARLEAALSSRALSLGHISEARHQGTVGGWIASRDAGETSGLDGRIEDRLLGLTLVDGLGRVHELSIRDGKDSAVGASALVASEGTLGIICAARLRVARRAPQHRFVTFEFDGFDAGLDALRALLRSGLQPAMARLNDPLGSALLPHALMNPGPKSKPHGSLRDDVEDYLRTSMSELVAGRLHGVALALNLAAKALSKSQLILVFEGEPALCALQVQEATRILSGLSGRDQGWELARHWFDNRLSEGSLYTRLASFGALCLDFDVAVDWATASRLCRKIKKALSPKALVIARLSQPRAGGAALHFTLIAPPEGSTEAMEVRRAELLNQALCLVRAQGGVFGHHGAVGIDRLAAFRAEIGAGQSLLRHLKARFDPEGRLNPGKLGLDALAPESVPAAPLRSEPLERSDLRQTEPDRGALSISRRAALVGKLNSVAGRLFEKIATNPEDDLERGSAAWALVRKVRRDAGVRVRLGQASPRVIELMPKNLHEAARALSVAQSMSAEAAAQGSALRLVLDGFVRLSNPNPFDGTIQVGAAVALTDVEAVLRRAGFTLGGLTLGARSLTVGEWLEGRWEGVRAGLNGGRLESSVLSLTAVLREGGVFQSDLVGMRAGPKLESLLLGGGGG
ncbi:MAG: FAD-binding oxidoreductase, partial [Myxococcales bacterium]|nr:FAD-binding oxidoreductase [Myxococcales bacterium]